MTDSLVLRLDFRILLIVPNASLSIPSVNITISASVNPPFLIISKACSSASSILLPRPGSRSGLSVGTILTIVLLSSVNGETTYASSP